MSTLNNIRIYFSVRNLQFSDNIKMVSVICEITSTTTGKSLKRKLAGLFRMKRMTVTDKF